MNPAPIAIFDSGLGGLSVVRHVRSILPHEDIVYFGDTARVPYGIKSRPTVAHFALETARFLLRFEPKLVVAACNTVSALALDELEAALPTPVVGVVKPGAAAAVRTAAGRPVAVLGTEATIASDAYRTAMHALDPGQQVVSLACPLFVPLVEEGRDEDDPIVRMAVETYLAPLRAQAVAAVVLGCTHYPLLHDAIAEFLGESVEIIDSGRETSRSVRALLEADAALSGKSTRGTLHCFVSDNPVRFERVGSRFLKEPIQNVEFVEAEQYVSHGRGAASSS